MVRQRWKFGEKRWFLCRMSVKCSSEISDYIYIEYDWCYLSEISDFLQGKIFQSVSNFGLLTRKDFSDCQ